MLRKKIIYIAFAGMVGFTGCTKNFETINVNPTTLTDLSTDALFTRTLLDVSGGEYEAWRTNFIYTTQFTQQFASTAWPQGDKYFFDEGYSSSLWDTYAQGAIKNLVNLIAKTEGMENDVNYRSAARIMKVYAFHRLTDLYGDVPYFEAGKGYLNTIFAPKYDAQQDIYMDMLKELEEAGDAFDAAKPFKGDITSYNGDVSLWKKAANSLMLRLAMRLTEADATAAAAWASKAASRGVFTSYTESLRIKHLEGQYDNPNSHVLGYYNGARNELGNNNFKLSKTFVDRLRTNNDPRLSILSVVRTNGVEDGTPAVQKGLPSGTDPGAIPDPIASYSQLRSDFVSADDPNILVSHAQTMLLLAEARERGYITTGSAEDYFRQGVKSAIYQLSLYNPTAGVLNTAAADAFAASVPYPAGNAIQTISEQYYIASLLDGYETFANYRRTGFPQLTAVNFPGNYTGGVIPSRMQYPSSESGLNGANLQEAISRQGANTFTTKVWWDK